MIWGPRHSSKPYTQEWGPLPRSVNLLAGLCRGDLAAHDTLLNFVEHRELGVQGAVLAKAKGVWEKLAGRASKRKILFFGCFPGWDLT